MRLVRNAIVIGFAIFLAIAQALGRRVRFDFALAEHRTLSRRTNARDLRRALAAERFLHGAGERRRFQDNRLRPNVAADFR